MSSPWLHADHDLVSGLYLSIPILTFLSLTTGDENGKKIPLTKYIRYSVLILHPSKQSASAWGDCSMKLVGALHGCNQVSFAII